ncbi:BAR-domain-containing protein [Cristinia sonorae]|uniref:BAR-domain-containing protein n=1 Tax=Cristinia sonorae TaxID=1940300 RepID=A0A8K0UR64_9AGAR|nr:BAR-domain-containing protein [Cristinia sonorae]
MPHMMTSKVGMAKKSNDPEFDDYNRRFSALEQAIEKLIKDTKAFSEAVTNLFTSGHNFAHHFSNLFHPVVGEYDLLTRHPQAEHTVKNVDAYEGALEELKGSIVPELELIETRIHAPMKELQTIMKAIRKTITKRDHKLVDYDRFNNSLTKLRDKKEKTLNDEKNLFKLEQDFEIATNEYEYINTSLKTELPKFMQMAAQFIDPLFHSFFYMQLNIFYLLLEKLSGFAESRYDVAVPAAQIEEDYLAKRGDAMQRLEELNIVKRIVSVSKMVQQNRLASGGEKPLGRQASTASSTASGTRGLAPPPMRSPSSASSTSSTYAKKAPPPPPSIGSAPPPPYSPSTNIGTKPAFGNVVASAVAAKKAPPPPPPLKPKPKPAVEYVVALYDFEAQADGDLDFKAGDRIEVVEKSDSTEDWWTGRLNGKQGVFPGNYVQ